jgi:hypothetical protein
MASGGFFWGESKGFKKPKIVFWRERDNRRYQYIEDIEDIEDIEGDGPRFRRQLPLKKTSPAPLKPKRL